jgi:hypothetical protein
MFFTRLCRLDGVESVVTFHPSYFTAADFRLELDEQRNDLVPEEFLS